MHHPQNKLHSALGGNGIAGMLNTQCEVRSPQGLARMVMLGKVRARAAVKQLGGREYAPSRDSGDMGL